MSFLFERLHADIKKSQENKLNKDTQTTLSLSDDDLQRISDNVAKSVYDKVMSQVISDNTAENENENENEMEEQ